MPKVAAPSLNVTIPVGAPTAGAVTATVPVKVTFCPVVEGLISEVTPMVVLPLFTTCVTVLDVLAA